ncbi:hypothetical protein LLG95_03675, partial [bacterium]|nr:hypothetical protein [bacterium]
MNRPVMICRMVLSQFLMLILMAASAPQAWAVADPVAAGAAWLEAHQDVIGGWDAWEPSHGFALQALNETSYQAAPAYTRLRGRVLATQSPRGNWTDTHYPVAGLIETGMSPTAPQVIQALAGLREVQKADGSWNGNVIDTQLAISSFVAADQGSDAAVQRAIAWIKSAQNADGGWGYKPGDSSDYNTYHACLALAQAAPGDAALASCRAWINRRFAVSTLPCEIAIEIEALIAIGDAAKTQTAAAGLVACQNAGGSWILYPGISTPYSTARGVTALRRARQAGVAGLDQSIANGSQWVLDSIDGAGDPAGRFEQVIETAQAAMALIAAGHSGQASVAGARHRLEAVPNPYYYWDFVFNGGCYEATGWGLAALAQSGGSAAKVQSIVDTLTISQVYPIGYWYRPDNVTYTVHALLGLANAGQAGSEPFMLGMDWLEGAYRSGMTFSTTDKALTLDAIRGLSRWAVLRYDLVTDLASIQNADGGWGEAAGQASRIDTTAAVVIGLQDTGYHSIPLSRGRAFLTAFQNPDGGWPEAAGLLESQTGPTGLATWALGEADTTGEIAVTVSTDKGVYASGQTVQINAATSVANPDAVEGAVIDGRGTRRPLLIARVDATHFTTQYSIPADQSSDRFIVEISATQGTNFGIGSAGFEVGLFRPVNVSPVDGASIGLLAPTLRASDFQSAGATHAASRWQVREAAGPSDWSDLAFDSGERTDALTAITIPVGILRPGVAYAWRVAYKDSAGLWSVWSLPTSFSTKAAFEAGIDWLIRHQVALGGWEPMDYLEGWTVELLTESGAKTSSQCELVHGRLTQMQYANGAWPWIENSSLSGLLIYGDSPSAPNITLGIRALKASQAANGSWPDSTTKSPDSVEITAAALRTLALAGEAGSSEALKAIAWLKSIQNSDHGWGGVPGAGSSDFTTLVVRALAMALGTSDAAVQSGYQYMISHPTPIGGWAKQYELDALVVMGDIARAQTSANQIASYQLPNGAWDFSGANYGDIGTTALMGSALSRARRAGVTVSSSVINNAMNFVKNQIQSDGTVLGNGNYARVDLSSLALMGLLSADQSGEPINRVRARFLAHTTPNWHNYFWINGYGTYSSALATAALISLGDSSALALASSTADQTLLNQKADGSWGALTGTGYPGTPSDTINALYGLRRASRQSNAQFDRGVAWLQLPPQNGQINNFYKGWLLMAITGIERFSSLRTSTIASLLASQNTDGGWGMNPGDSSSCEVTAAVILGLDTVATDQAVLARGRAWLLASQNPDAGWGQFAGALASDTKPTALAVWALAETADIPGLVLTVTTDRRSYVGGETATISAASTIPDVDLIQGSVTGPGGERTDLAFTKLDSTHFSAEYAIPAAQWPGAFIAAVSATKGELYGAAARGFEVGLFRPINILPRDRTTSTSLAPTLRASDFDGSRTLAAHVASQWQVRDLSSPPDYSSVIFDSGVDTVHLTSITMPLGRLLYSSNYAWTVRYKDSLGRWSAWSIETSFSTIAASQFGERLVFDMDGDIWIMNTAGTGDPTRLTAGPARDMCPRISPDGQWVAFSSDQGGPYQIWLMHPDGSGARPIGGFQSGNPICLDWSPASTSLVASATGDTIHIVPIDGSGATQIAYYPLVQVRHLAWSTQNRIAVELSPFGNPSYSVICSVNPDGTGLVNLVSGGRAPAWTPDGSLLAAGINNDIWTVNANGTGLTRRIDDGDVETAPAWTGDASTMFYRSYPAANPGVSTIMAAA